MQPSAVLPTLVGQSVSPLSARNTTIASTIKLIAAALVPTRIMLWRSTLDSRQTNTPNANSPKLAIVPNASGQLPLASQ